MYIRARSGDGVTCIIWTSLGNQRCSAPISRTTKASFGKWQCWTEKCKTHCDHVRQVKKKWKVPPTLCVCACVCACVCVCTCALCVCVAVRHRSKMLSIEKSSRRCLVEKWCSHNVQLYLGWEGINGKPVFMNRLSTTKFARLFSVFLLLKVRSMTENLTIMPSCPTSSLQNT
jgi:hypothetical protein